MNVPQLIQIRALFRVKRQWFSHYLAETGLFLAQLEKRFTSEVSFETIENFFSMV